MISDQFAASSPDSGRGRGKNFELSHSKGSSDLGGQIIIRLLGLHASGNQGNVANFNPAQGYAVTFAQTGSITDCTPSE